MITHDKRPILLVDDHAAVRHGLALVLAEEGVGECCEAADRKRRSLLPGPSLDLALVDLSPGTEDALNW